MTTGDFNKDGKLDLAIAGSGSSGPEVVILLVKVTGHSEQQSDIRLLDRSLSSQETSMETAVPIWQ